MKRLTAYATGRVQRTGYRARVIEIARAFGLKGTIQNLADGSVKIIAEGDETDLRRFADAIKIRDALVYVVSLSEVYSEVTGDFENFYKLVDQGETDERLDQGAALLRELITTVKDGFKDLGVKMDHGFGDLGKRMDQGFGDLSGKMGIMLEKQDQMLKKQDQMLKKQCDFLNEVKDARKDFKGYLDERFEKIEVDVAGLKSTLKQKGII